jgi:hypothetical protein
MKEKIRNEAESITISMNNVLRDRVKTMSNVTLLRNIHPSYRESYAYQFLREEMITKDEAKEFVRLVR